ncbi:MAG TPA: outer membrane protein transport protein [Candidatus Krumholzibacteria bacterium]|nr:outer membrane protein transport protein [Candidatus Krumholzibacteria bacterium]
MKRQLVLIALAVLFAPLPSAWAAGFNIYEMGSRATALGGAFTATADDPSAIFFNPAGLSFQPEGWQLSLNVSPLHPESKFTRSAGATALSYPGDVQSATAGKWFFPTGAYLSYKQGDWSAGFGVFTPFGLGVDWDRKDTFAGRPLSSNAEIQGYYLSPVVSYQPHRRLALSIGAHAVITHLTLENIATANLGTGADDLNIADVKINGTSHVSMGLAAALMYKPIDPLTLGLNYKMGVTNKFRGADATVTQRLTGSQSIDAAVTAALGSKLGTQGVSGDLDFPDLLMSAVRYEFSPRFALEADYVLVGWSTFDQVTLEFADGSSETLTENYENAWQIRVGGEYRHSDQLRFMAGYVHDTTPQPTGSISPLLPDANRNDYSLGVTWTSRDGRYDLTGGYMLVEFEDRNTIENGVGQNYDGLDGAYSSRAHIITLGYTRRF